MNLQDALEFVRNSDPIEWNVLVGEMNATRERREIKACEAFHIGQEVAVEGDLPGEALKGHVLNKSRGRVTVGRPIKNKNSPQEVVIAPASRVRALR